MNRPDAAPISKLDISDAFNQLFAHVSPRPRLELAGLTKTHSPSGSGLDLIESRSQSHRNDSSSNEQVQGSFQFHSEDELNTSQESHLTYRKYPTYSIHNMLQGMKKRRMNMSISSLSSAVFSSSTSIMSEVNDSRVSSEVNEGFRASKDDGGSDHCLQENAESCKVQKGQSKAKSKSNLKQEDCSTTDTLHISHASDQPDTLLGSYSVPTVISSESKQAAFSTDSCVAPISETEGSPTVTTTRKSLRLERKRSSSLKDDKDKGEVLKVKKMGSEDSKKRVEADKENATHKEKSVGSIRKSTTRKERTAIEEKSANKEKVTNKEKVLVKEKDVETKKKRSRSSERKQAEKKIKTTAMPVFDKEATVLTDWIIKPLPDCQGVCVEGKKRDLEDFWHSTAVFETKTAKLVQTISGSVYRLEGPINKLCTIDNGFSKEVANAFAKGFPANWKNIIRSFYKDLQTRCPIVSAPPVPTHMKPGDRRKSQKLRTSISRNGKDAAANRLCTESIITPAGLIKQKLTKADMTVTRSGRISLPPLARWAGQRYTKLPGSNGVQVQFETEFAKQVVSRETKEVFQLAKRFQKMIYHKSLSSDHLTSLSPKIQCTGTKLDGKGKNYSSAILPKDSNHRDCSGRQGKLSDSSVTKGKTPKKVKNASENNLILPVSGSVNVQTSGKSCIEKGPTRNGLMGHTVNPSGHELYNSLITPDLNDGNGSEFCKNKSTKSLRKDICTAKDFQRGSPNLTDPKDCSPVLKRGGKKLAQTDVTLSKSSKGRGTKSKQRKGRQNKTRVEVCPGQANENATAETRGKSGPRMEGGNGKLGKEQENCQTLENMARVGSKRLRGRTLSCLSPGCETTDSVQKNTNTSNSQINGQQFSRRKEKSILRENLWSTDSDFTSISTSKTVKNVSDKDKNCGLTAKTLSVSKDSEGQLSNSRKRKLKDPPLSGREVSRDGKNNRPNKRRKTEDTGKKSDWTKTETNLFYRALREVSGEDLEYWSKISAIVRTRTQLECQEFHRESLEDKDKTKETKSLKKSEEKLKKRPGRQKGEPIRGGKGTLKRKEDLRDLLDEQNEGHEDDLFEGSPYVSRKPASSVFAVNFDKDDSEVFGSNHNFFTPVAGKKSLLSPGTRPRAQIASIRRTPAVLTTDTTPVSINRRVADRYIKNFIDRKKKQEVAPGKEKEGVNDLESSTLPIRSLFSPVAGPSVLLDGPDDIDEDIEEEEEEDNPYLYYWDTGMED